MGYDCMHDELFSMGLRIKRFRWEKLHNEMSCTEFHILGILMRYKKKKPEKIGVYASEIADIMKISRPAVSKQLQQMEDKGWIKRVTDPNSKRNTFVQILPKGETIFIRQRDSIGEFWEKVCRRAGEEQVRNMIDGINSIIDAAQDELDNISEEGEVGHR